MVVTAFFTLLSQPSQSILTLISTVWEREHKPSLKFKTQEREREREREREVHLHLTERAEYDKVI
jgi:hypothetical protein